MQVTVVIAANSKWAPVPAPNSSRPTTIALNCPTRYFGFAGSTCAPCPVGADCAGNGAAPLARLGFYPLSASTFVQCEPQEACLGGANATCAAQYTGVRCAECKLGSYRCDLQSITVCA
jgi:hypothetical protein